MNNEQIKQLKQLCEKYELEANCYLTELDNKNKAVDAIIVLDGIIVRLYADIRSYELKHGDNGKLKQHKERLSELELIRDVFWDTEGRSQKMKLLLRKSNRKLFLLEKENTELIDKINGINNAFDGI